MTPVCKSYVDTGEGQIHYRYIPGTEKEPGTPLIFLHQTASSSAMWEQVMQRLDGKRSLFALDTPGFGASYDPSEVPSISYYTQVLVEALDGIGIERFHVCGHHTGVCMAVEMAAKWPKRVASLAMIGPVQLTQEERDEFRKHFSEPFAPDAEGNYLRETWDYLGRLGANGSLDLHHRELVDTCRAWRGRVQAYNAVWDQDFPALFESAKCPVLLMAARDDVLWPYFERACDARPDARSAVVSGANFEPDLDPDGVADAVRKFLGA